MPTPLIAKTAGEATVEVAGRLPQCLVEKTTATAGAAGTVTLGNVPIKADVANDDYFNDLWAYIFAGTSAGDERHIDDYAGATRVATTAPNWSSTPDTTSELIICRGFRPSELYRSVEEAIREAAQVLHTPLVDTSLRIGNLLHNGHFEQWDGPGAVSSGSFIRGSDGWKVQGALATGTRESTFARNTSPYTQHAAKLVSNTTNEAYLEWLIPDWGRRAGLTVDIKGWVYTTAASRVRLRVQDGVTGITDMDTGDHSGTPGWEELSVTGLTVNSAATKLAAECYIEGTAAGALTAYFDDIRLTPSRFLYEHRIPPWFTFLSELWVESGTEGVFDQEVPQSWWANILTHDDGEPYLWMDPSLVGGDGSSLPNFDTLGGVFTKGRHLLLKGQGYRTDAIAVTTDIERAYQYVVDRATAQVAQTRMGGGSDTARFYAALYDRYNQRAERVLARQPTRRATNSVRVRG